MFPYNQINVDRINQQIQELERLKSNYQSMQNTPTNIINVGNTTQTDFKAQYINENDKVDEILVNCKTAFICLKKGYLKIKEINGDITEYILTKPKTEQELRIEELERRLSYYEQPNNANNEITKSKDDVIEYDDTTTKNSSRGISKKS